MPPKTLPYDCIVDWNEAGTKLFMCEMHQFQYNLWEGSEEEFVIMIATPAGDGNDFETEALSE